MKSSAGDYATLAKFRLVFMASLEAAIAFWLASPGPVNKALLACTFLGCYLLGGGASTFNQIIEQRLDGLMRRTCDRPLPAGRLSNQNAVTFGLILSASGLIVLYFWVNPLSALLGTITLVAYLGVYTPMKRVSIWNTFIGAFPGALPCLIGWAGARNRLDIEALALFGIVFFWQLPHFFSIAWLYREDYQRAGFRMLPSVDASGRQTAAQIIFFSILLLLVSLTPVQAGLAGPIYLVAALAAGGAMVFLAFFLAITRLRFARGFMMVSIYYLILIMSGLAVDRL